jgi:dolichol kinase
MTLLVAEAVRALAVAAGFLLVLATAEVWRRRWNPPVEWTRKFVHFTGGLLGAAFPWIFASHWTVLVLAVGFAGVLMLARRLRRLESVHGVRRTTGGALYYPVALYLLFLVGSSRPVFYLIAVLVLVLADALAAVVGAAYGRWVYEIENERKSVEGSAVFLLVTFLAVHLPLLLLTEVDRTVSVLVALQVALVATSLEAISLRGADNLILPLATFYILMKAAPKPPEFTALLVLAHLGLIAATILFVRATRLLTFSGGIATHLVFVAAVALGGPVWLVPPALSLAAFLGVEHARRRADTANANVGGYQVLGVFYVSIVSLGVLAADNSLRTLLAAPEGLPGSTLYPVYTAAFAAQLAVAIYRLGPVFDARRVLFAGTASFAAVVPASLALASGNFTARAALTGAAIIFGSLLLYSLVSRRVKPMDTLRTLQLQAAAAAAPTAAALTWYLR